MSDMAGMALAYAASTEEELFNYYSGSMSTQEAYDKGLVDQSGFTCQTPPQWIQDHDYLAGYAELNNEVKTHLSALQSTAECSFHSLNKQAIANLSKSAPTCNSCRKEMEPREGKFGKFYFCTNHCVSQKAVSDSYWQSIKDNK